MPTSLDQLMADSEVLLQRNELENSGVIASDGGIDQLRKIVLAKQILTEREARAALVIVERHHRPLTDLRWQLPRLAEFPEREDGVFENQVGMPCPQVSENRLGRVGIQRQGAVELLVAELRQFAQRVGIGAGIGGFGNFFGKRFHGCGRLYPPPYGNPRHSPGDFFQSPSIRAVSPKGNFRLSRPPGKITQSVGKVGFSPGNLPNPSVR